MKDGEFRIRVSPRAQIEASQLLSQVSFVQHKANGHVNSLAVSFDHPQPGENVQHGVTASKRCANFFFTALTLDSRFLRQYYTDCAQDKRIMIAERQLYGM
jgi:hypothetical protein